MPSLRDIKRRITSVRAQEAIVRTRPYAYEMRKLVNNVAARADDDLHPLLRPGGGGKAGLIVVTSDRGLCGGFNSNIVNHTMQALKTQFEGRDVELTVVGRKGVEAFKRRPVTVREQFTGQQDIPAMRLAANVIDDIVRDFMKGGADEVYCLYNEFKSAVQQSVTLERMLPFERGAEDAGADAGVAEPAEERGEEEVSEEGAALDYLYEPTQTAVFEALLVRHLHVQMHRILHESAASEYGARMTAMDEATRNAGDVIDRLTLQYNRARQDAITKELIEVISGAEAL